MEKDAIVTLLDVQRNIFNDTIDRLHNQIKEDQKEREKSFSDLIRSIEFTQKEVDQQKAKIEFLQKEREKDSATIMNLRSENDVLRNQVTNLNEKLDGIDDHGRRNNLKFSGIQEVNNENPEQSHQRVNRFLQEHLKISPAIEQVRRIGKSFNQRPRDIIVRFQKVEERNKILRERTKLKGTSVYINEDFCPGTIEAQKKQMDQYHSARRDGKIVYFNRKKLVIKERVASEGVHRSRRDPPPSITLDRNREESTVVPGTPPAGAGGSASSLSSPLTPLSSVSSGIKETLRSHRIQQSNTHSVRDDASPLRSPVVAELNTAGGRRKDTSVKPKASRGKR